MSASRSWNVPDNLPALKQYAEDGHADELEEITPTEAQQAFLDAAAISHRLGGDFAVSALRVERSDRWITLGYVFFYRSFNPGVDRARQSVPKGEGEPEPSIVDPEPVEA